ncbi:4Fe-4S dicluster domain-containing protein [Candidatus Bipolaricaulota bacterium]|nr:4Fe-4S dicluster domain-containing protein [Candidatus Bipolaricaulota bacterium]MBS3814161.1 4Fe-4S dicluster domain-containing protein [Candidatus Bipolaricaulota bacterium]
MQLNNADRELIDKIEELSGENVFSCYQCGKCSAGCPFTEEMDLLPNQVIRKVQMGDVSVLQSETPWICASCLSCEVDCPKGNNVPAIMEAIREISLRENVDKVELKDLKTRGLPEIALVSNFRKKTS